MSASHDSDSGTVTPFPGGGSSGGASSGASGASGGSSRTASAARIPGSRDTTAGEGVAEGAYPLLPAYLEFFAEMERQRQRVVSGAPLGDGASDGSSSSSDTSSADSSSDGASSSGTSSNGTSSSGTSSSGTTDGGSSSSSSSSSSSASSTGDQGPRQVLLSLLERQADEAAGVGSEASYARAQYVMAVFADEVFLGLVWPGRSAWAQATLESTLFGTDDGRDEVFRRIDRLLAEHADPPPAMADVHLLNLTLGFRGRYRGPQEQSHLDAYRRRLWTWIHGDAKAGVGRLFPEAYLYTRSRGDAETLPALAPWIVALAAAVVVFFVASAIVWWDGTATVAALVRDILSLP